MNISNSRVLVTGGAGFIGSHIVHSLVIAGAHVTVYDNFSFGRRENLSGVSDDIDIVEGDILDYDSLASVMAGHDLVSHHAAQLEIFLSVEHPKDDLETNTIGTLNVLRAAKEAGVKKVINASSACIYGQTDVAAAEGMLPVPNWSYGVSKLAAERYCHIYSTYHDLPVTSLRYGITYGEREWYRRVLTIFIKRALLKQPLVVFGDGEQVRDFVYVGDAVRLHNLCVEDDAVAGESYNVGTGIGTHIHDLAAIVADVAGHITGHQPEVVFENTPEGEFSKLVSDKRRNPAELRMMLLNPGKATRDLGWEPEVDLCEGVTREISWAASNLDRWDRVHYTAS